MASEEPEALPAPEGPKEPSPQEQAEAFIRTVMRQEIEAYDKALQKKVDDWMGRVEAVLKTSPAPVPGQSTSRGDMVGQAIDRLAPRLMNAIGLPGGEETGMNELYLRVGKQVVDKTLDGTVRRIVGQTASSITHEVV